MNKQQQQQQELNQGFHNREFVVYKVVSRAS